MEKWGRGGIRIGGNHSVGWNGSKKGGRTRLPAEIAGEMMKSRGKGGQQKLESSRSSLREEAASPRRAPFLRDGVRSIVEEECEEETIVGYTKAVNLRVKIRSRKNRASNTSWNYRSLIFHQAQ